MPGPGAPIAVHDPAPGTAGVSVGVDLSSAEADSLTELAGRLRRAATDVLVPGPALASVVAAVPDTWLASGVDGAARREVVRLVLADDRGLPLRAIIGRSQAVVALSDRREKEPPGTAAAAAVQVAIVCHIDEAPAADIPAGPGAPDPLPSGPAPAIRLARCATTSRGIRLLDCDTHRLPPGAASFGPALAAELVAHAGAPPRAAGQNLLGAVYAELGRRRQRLEIALAAAESNPAFLGTPVVGLPGAPPSEWASAAQVQRCFAPTAQVLAVAISGAARSSPPAASVILAGPGAANPLAQDLVTQEITRHAANGRAPGVIVVAEQAVAEGAALIAARRMVADLATAADVRLPVHRLAGGQLRAETIPLTTAGHGGAEPAGRDGSPVTVQVSGAERPDVRLEILPEKGAAVSVAVTMGAPVAEGSYQVGLWPDVAAGAILALRPVGGAPAILLPMPPDARRALARGAVAEED